MSFGEKIRGLIWTYGLAACCVIGPLVLGYGAPNLVANKLMPLDKDKPSPFVYLFTDGDVVGLSPAERLARDVAAQEELKQALVRFEVKKADVAKLDAKASQTETVRTELKALETAYTAARDEVSQRMARRTTLTAEALAGRYGYAGASGFLYVAAAAALLLAGAIVMQTGGVALLGFGFLFFVAVALTVANLPTAYENGGRLLLDVLFDKADASGLFDTLRASLVDPAFKISKAAKSLVWTNTFVGLVPVGMVLLAFAGLAIRAPENELNRQKLKWRQKALKGLIVVSSVILVIATFASKVLLDWPLKLVTEAQAKALQPLASSLTSHLGITGTIALFAAALPAILAWQEDVERFRQVPVGNGGGAGAAEPDGLDFATSETITSVIAILAPAVASPLFTNLQAALGSLSK